MGEQTKLTPLQAETLIAIHDGGVANVNCGHSAWRVFGAPGPVVGVLVRKGLAQWLRAAGDRQPCELTEAGRALLASDQAQ